MCQGKCRGNGKEEAQRIKKYCRGKWKAFGQMRCGRGEAGVEGLLGLGNGYDNS